MKRWSKKKIFGIWFLCFAALAVIINEIPGATYIDTVTGENRIHSIAAWACVAISVSLTFLIVKRHNCGNPVFRKPPFKQASTSENDWSKVDSLNYSVTDDRDLLPEAKKVILESGQASVSILQRKMSLGYARAARLLDWLEEEGFVGPFSGSAPREILAQPHQRKNSLSDVDLMEGHDFEYWCADLLKQNGFEKVEVTPGSGDQGVDVLAEKDGIKYAIQCKCYSKDLGNTPIQEVEAGRIFYSCHVGAVMTNRHFTPGAKELAHKTGTLLWDRDYIEKMFTK